MTDSPEDIVDGLLADIPGSKPCAVERNAPLAAALRHYMALYADGTTKVSLQWFYEEKLKAAFNGPSMTTVRRWHRAEVARTAE